MNIICSAAIYGGAIAFTGYMRVASFMALLQKGDWKSYER